MQLADEQATANLEGKVQCGFVSARHFYAVQRGVCAVVDDFGDGRIEEQGQVDTGQQQHNEAVQCDLAKQEGPVRRKDLVDLCADARRECVAGINVVAHLG